MGVSWSAGLAAILAAVAVGLPSTGTRRIRRRLFDPGSSTLPSRGQRRFDHGNLGPVALLEWLGRLLPGAEPPDHAVIGAAAMGLVATAVVAGPIACLVGLVAVAALLRARVRARRLEHQRRVEWGLPEVVDLLGLVVGAGQPTAPALAVISPRTPEPFRSELADVVRRSSAGEPFAESMRRLRRCLGPAVAPLVHAVVAAEADGVALGPALVRVGDEARRRRRVRAEEAARRVPVLMLFPLVFCVLPAFGLLTVVPLVVGSIADLGLPG